MTDDLARSAAVTSAVVAPAHPNRRTLRTVVAFVIALAPTLPAIVHSSGLSDASPWVGAALSIAAGVTRVMALPQTEVILRRFAPWLAAGDVDSANVIAQMVTVPADSAGLPPFDRVVDGEVSVAVAGEAHLSATGTPVDVIDVEAQTKPPRRKRPKKAVRAR